MQKGTTPAWIHSAGETKRPLNNENVWFDTLFKHVHISKRGTSRDLTCVLDSILFGTCAKRTSSSVTVSTHVPTLIRSGNRVRRCCYNTLGCTLYTETPDLWNSFNNGAPPHMCANSYPCLRILQLLLKTEIVENGHEFINIMGVAKCVPISP